MSAVKRSSDNNVLNVTVEDWKHARVVGPSITRGVTVEVPKVSWEDIGGLRGLKVWNLERSYHVRNYDPVYLHSICLWTEKTPTSC